MIVSLSSVLIFYFLFSISKTRKGLTLSKVYDKTAILDYTSKQETRVGETIYCGKKEMYNIKFQKLLKHQ